MLKEEGVIITRDGDKVEIEDWVREQEEEQKNKEYRKEEREEIKKKRKMIKRRDEKYVIIPEYDKGPSKVKYLSNEEINEKIVKEYIMIKSKKNLEEMSIPESIISFLKEIGGRKVSVGVIASAVGRSSKSVSSTLSRLYTTDIVTRISIENNTRRFLWGLSPIFKEQKVPEIKKIFNKNLNSRRKEQEEGNKSLPKVNIPIETKIQTLPSKSESIVKITIEGSIEDILRFIERIKD